MALIHCSECAKEISDQAATCPGCGAPVAPGVKAPQQVQAKPNGKLSGGQVVVILLLAGLMVYGYNKISSWFASPSAGADTSASASASLSNTEPAAAAAPASQDAQLVKSTIDKMAATEGSYIEQQKNFFAMFNTDPPPKGPERDAFTKKVLEAVANMMKTLKDGEKIEVPALKDANAQRYLTEAVDFHKKWIEAQQAKIGFSLKGDVKNGKMMGDAADHLALQEAMSMNMAGKAVGLP